MMEKENSELQPNFLDLRKQAEEKLRQKNTELSTFSDEKKDKLINELQVHQIELEMQNEELRNTQLELSKTKDEYTDLYDNAPVGYFLLNENGIISKVNQTLANMLDVKRAKLLNIPFANFVDYDFQDNFYFFLNQSLQFEESQEVELKLKKGDGSEFYASLKSVVVEKSANDLVEFRIIVTDITERKQAEEDLQKAHDELECKVESRTAELTKINLALENEISERISKDKLLNESERLSRMLMDSLPHPAMLINKSRTVIARNRIADELGVNIGSKCWKTFGQSLYLSGENKKLIENDKEPLNPMCHFCLAEKAIEGKCLINDPSVETVGIFDTYWVHVEKDIYLHYAIDVTERKQAEEKLVRSEAFLEKTGQISKVGGWEIDGETKKVFWTKEIYNITEVPDGYDPSSLEHEAIVFFNAEDQLILDKVIQRAFEHNEPYDLKFLITTAKGNKKWIRTISVPVVINSKVVKLSGTFQDITERKLVEGELEKHRNHLEQLVKERTAELQKEITEHKQAEKALKESEERFWNLFDNMSSGCGVWKTTNGNEFRLVDLNISGEKIDNVKKEDIVDKNIVELFPDPERKYNIIKFFKRVWKTGKPERLPIMSFNISGINVWRENYIYKLSTGEVVVVFNDITERKQAEEKIKASLKEKETLLNEIHHRVKNNLNVVSSLLSLQAGKTDNDQAKSALMDSKNRVQSMSAIHETLYQSENFSAVDMETYLSDLAGTVAQNYTNGSKINLVIEAKNILIVAKQASPVGLIVNEMITNSFKYAFPDDQKGEIKISLQKMEDQIELVYSDNGIGIPENFDWKNTKSMGLNLIKILSENQLDGTIDMESNNGTKFTIKFNIDET